MVRLAEERREVRGHRVDEFLELVAFARLEQLDVIGEAVHAQRTQPARQAPIHELALGFGQCNAGVLAHQLAQPPELRVGKREVGNRQLQRQRGVARVHAPLTTSGASMQEATSLSMSSSMTILLSTLASPSTQAPSAVAPISGVGLMSSAAMP